LRWAAEGEAQVPEGRGGELARVAGELFDLGLCIVVPQKGRPIDGQVVLDLLARHAYRVEVWLALVFALRGQSGRHA
jgi:hypothetical protein